MNFNQMVNKILMVVHDLIQREVPKLAPPLRWATVQTTNPLRIKFDGPGGDLDAKPDETVGLMVPGDRVTVHHKNGDTPIITGVSGGAGLGTRSFQTLALAQAAGLPVGAQVWVVAEDQGYVLGSSGLEPSWGPRNWVPIVPLGIWVQAYADQPPVASRKDGMITLSGALRPLEDLPAATWVEVGQLPPGYHPYTTSSAIYLPLSANSATHLSLQITAGGLIRVWSSVSAGPWVHINGQNFRGRI